MKIFHTTAGLVAEAAGACRLFPASTQLDALFAASRPADFLRDAFAQGTATVLPSAVLAPIQNQEVWAAGVTYLRSRVARVAESKDAGGGVFYDKVYEAARPELFFKATAHRVAEPGGAVLIRSDSRWNVPEPELTLAFSAGGDLIGYTIGNDMSSRDIEAENPLYLPQAKLYHRSAALGPCLWVTPERLPPTTEIQLEIARAGALVFTGSTSISRIKRSFEELGGYLFKANRFPAGCYLMTGTGIVPPDDFTLAAGDRITIRIDPIGVLVNHVEVAP